MVINKMNRLFKFDSVEIVLSTHFETVTLSTKSTQIMRVDHYPHNVFFSQIKSKLLTCH